MGTGEDETMCTLSAAELRRQLKTKMVKAGRQREAGGVTHKKKSQLSFLRRTIPEFKS